MIFFHGTLTYYPLGKADYLPCIVVRPQNVSLSFPIKPYLLYLGIGIRQISALFLASLLFLPRVFIFSSPCLFIRYLPLIRRVCEAPFCYTGLVHFCSAFLFFMTATSPTKLHTTTSMHISCICIPICRWRLLYISGQLLCRSSIPYWRKPP